MLWLKTVPVDCYSCAVSEYCIAFHSSSVCCVSPGIKQSNFCRLPQEKVIYQLPISMFNSGFACNGNGLNFVTKTSIDTAKNGPLKMASTARTALGWRNVSDISDWHPLVQTSFENPRNVSTCVKRPLHDPWAFILCPIHKIASVRIFLSIWMYLENVERRWRTSHH